MTRAGVILGTAAYMSPEQARGATVDELADIWAFGVVLYEMLTRRACFGGNTVTDVLAAVVKSEPDWSALPPDTPWRLRELLRRCLTKDSKQRLHDIGDARLEIEESLVDGRQPVGTSAALLPAHPRAPWPLLAVLMAFVAVAAVGVAWREHAARATIGALSPPMRFAITLPSGFRLVEVSPAISGDGQTLAFLAESAGIRRIFVRRIGVRRSWPGGRRRRDSWPMRRCRNATG